jgi:hypothetical protein
MTRQLNISAGNVVLLDLALRLADVDPGALPRFRNHVCRQGPAHAGPRAHLLSFGDPASYFFAFSFETMKAFKYSVGAGSVVVDGPLILTVRVDLLTSLSFVSFRQTPMGSTVQVVDDFLLHEFDGLYHGCLLLLLLVA